MCCRSSTAGTTWLQQNTAAVELLLDGGHTRVGEETASVAKTVAQIMSVSLCTFCGVFAVERWSEDGRDEDRREQDGDERRRARHNDE